MLWLLEGIEKGDDSGGILVGQNLMAGDGELLGVNLLSDGKRLKIEDYSSAGGEAEWDNESQFLRHFPRDTAGVRRDED